MTLAIETNNNYKRKTWEVGGVDYIHYHFGNYLYSNPWAKSLINGKQDIFQDYVRSNIKKAFEERLKFASGNKWTAKRMEEFLIGVGGSKGYTQYLQEKINEMASYNFNKGQILGNTTVDIFQILESKNPAKKLQDLAQQDANWMKSVLEKCNEILELTAAILENEEFVAIKRKLEGGKNPALNEFIKGGLSGLKAVEKGKLYKQLSVAEKKYFKILEYNNIISRMCNALKQNNGMNVIDEFKCLNNFMQSSNYLIKELGDGQGALLAASEFAKNAVVKNTGSNTGGLNSEFFVNMIYDKELLELANERYKSSYKVSIKDDSEIIMNVNGVTLLFGLSSKNLTNYIGTKNYSHNIDSIDSFNAFIKRASYYNPYELRLRKRHYMNVYGARSDEKRGVYLSNKTGITYSSKELLNYWKDLVNDIGRLGFLDSLMGRTNENNKLVYGNNSLIFISGKNVFYMGDIIKQVISNPNLITVSTNLTLGRAGDNTKMNKIVPTTDGKTIKEAAEERSEKLKSYIDSRFNSAILQTKLNIAQTAVLMNNRTLLK